MEFKKYRLSDIAHIQTGPFGSQLHKEDYVESGIPIITVEHLGENKIIHSNLPRVNKEDWERLSKYILKKNDIVFSRVGSVDRCALVSHDEENWLFSGRCLRVRVKDLEIIDPKYLSYYFATKNFKRYIRSIAVGATMPSINTKILSEIQLEIPDIDSQRKIAELFYSLDAKKWINENIIKNLGNVSKAIFQHWFVDFEFPNEEGEPYKSSGGEMRDSEFGKIPAEFRESTFDSLGTIIGGGTPSKKNEEYYTSDGISWITPKDLSNNKNIFIYKGALDITELGLKKGSARLLPENTVLFTSRAPIGYIAIAGKKVTTNQGFKSIVPDKGYSQYFIYHLLKFKLPVIEAAAGGSTFKEISGKGLKEIFIPLPPIKLVNRYKEMVEPLFLQIQTLESENQKLIHIRDILLPKLISGEIEIPKEREV